MPLWIKHGARRAEVRRNRPDSWHALLDRWRQGGVFPSLAIAAAFYVLAIAILLLRTDTVAYRPGQYVPQDITSRVSFSFADKDLLTRARNDAREATGRIYSVASDQWDDLEKSLLALPDRVAGKTLAEVPKDLLDVLPLTSGSLSELQQVQATPLRDAYNQQVHSYVFELRGIVIIPQARYREEMESPLRQYIVTEAPPPVPAGAAPRGRDNLNSKHEIYPDSAGPPDAPGAALCAARFTELRQAFDDAARHFAPALRSKISLFTVHTLHPTYDLDAQATTEAENRAADAVRPEQGQTLYSPRQTLVSGDTYLNDKQWQLLQAENEQYNQGLGVKALENKAGLAGMVLLLTAVLAVYVGYFQPRVMRRHIRAVAIAALLLAMLLLAQLAAVGTGPLYFFGVAPTILTAIILAIAYDRRFAMGVASMQGLLVTLAIAPVAQSGQGIGFFLILFVGVLACCFLMGELRTRSKLIEVGGLTALAMIAATIAVGAASREPFIAIGKNSLYTGAAGLCAGFIALGILPFIEKIFRITSSMTLLELADASQPLLRRMALEAPGTYNHSLQVAVLSEAAAESIIANSLLCRVGAYYHDIGKINKPEYFIENQRDGQNRHLNLSPSVSLLIIVGHVKDGIELAREYNLPTVLYPFIQQHHGTTLVEPFYLRAWQQKGRREPDDPSLSETEFRYPGPKPRSKETAILMLADALESSARAMVEPTPTRIEGLVHDLALKRLLDNQFEDCDLTLKELALVESALVRALLNIYHGRLAYPSTSAITGAPAVPLAAPVTAKSG